MTLAFAFVVTASLSTVSPSMAVTAQAVTKPSKAKLSTVNSINATGEGDSTELIIKLSAPATYTSYKTTAPLRLVLDLSQTSQGDIVTPITLNKGNFKSVTVSRFDTDAGVLTRMYIELNKDIEAQIIASKENPGELKISFPSVQKTTLARTEPESKPVPAVASAAPLKAEVPKAAPAVPELPARTLTDIAVKNNTIVIAVNGGAADFTSFRLNKPERLVIDVPAAVSTLSSKIIPLNVAGVASARIGLYPDKVRVVLDSVDGAFPEATAKATQEGVVVSLVAKPAENPNTKLVATQVSNEPIAEKAVEKPKQAPEVKVVPKEASKPVATEKPMAPVVKNEKAQVAAPAVKPVVTEKTVVVEKTVIKSEKPSVNGPASVEMIDFQVVEGISRVAVKVKGDVTVEPPVKSAGFITMTVKNASIPKQLQRSLDAQSFISPVLRVTPLVVKTKKGTDIKIRIAMRTAVTPSFRQEGDMLYVDFTNPVGLTADKLPAEMQDIKRQPSKTTKHVAAKESDMNTELTGQTESVSAPLNSTKVYKGRKVTLEFADAEVRKIFQLLSEVSGKNFVLGDEVAGTISLKLVNVPWDQALDIIMDTKSLDMRDNGNVLTIKGKGKFKSQEEESQELRKIQQKSIELKSATFDINYSDAASIVAQISSLKTDRGAITQDPRTNKVIVKDIPQVIDDMRRLISQLDVPEKQVMIEARIVEATSTFTRSLGVNWGLHFKDGSASFMGINQMDTSFGGVASTPPPASGLSGNSGGAMGISFGTLTSNVSLDLRLNAAASAGLVRIVSTPKVATLNNKTAKITQGQQVPYTASTSDKVETKFVEAALSLEVTPHINANGTIGMKIDAKNDSVGQATGGSTAPAINKKQATTEMLLRDGETTVIGGIYVDSDNESDDGVPYLMDMPFLGKLFKSNSKTKVKTELLIFITPRILNTI
jgi:type IV pilus assembly protein PilQ